jgi:hypothetical protein
MIIALAIGAGAAVGFVMGGVLLALGVHWALKKALG